MEKNKKLNSITKIIILILIMMFMISLLGINKTKASVMAPDKKSWGMLFKDDLGTLNYHELPAHLFGEANIYLFCSEHGTDVDGYMTATQALYNAYMANSSGAQKYDENSPLKYYRNSSSVGIRENHFLAWKALRDAIEKKNTDSEHSWTYDDFDNSLNQQAILNDLKFNLPGGTYNPDHLFSIKYELQDTYNIDNYQGAAFVVTQEKRYANALTTPLAGGGLTDAEKEKGYFDVDEKQAALWDKKLGLNIGREKDKDDRGLADIAIHYQEFNKAIKSSGYGSIVNVTPTGAGGIDQTSTNINGETLSTYKYKDAGVAVNIAAKSYVIGPFCVDYTYDDANKDTYHSTATNEVKYNAIEKITVYNQNKVDIESLGGSFKIAYSANGGEQRIHRISDENAYALADYAEVPAFESGKPFYIIVNRGSMKAEDFTGFYAKVDFQYLENITATLYRYHGYVDSYYYKEEAGDTEQKTYKYSYHDNEKNWETDDGWWEDPTTGLQVPEGTPGAQWHENKNDHHSHDYHEGSDKVDIKTHKFELNMARTTASAQQMVGYGGDGKRTYKRYSIILTTNWLNEEKPSIELYKECADDKEALYGAKYTVSLKIQGRDAKGNNINKVVEFTRTTDINGILAITTSDLKEKGVYIGTFTGTIVADFKEIQAPANHDLGAGDVSVTITLQSGIITSGGTIDRVKNSTRVIATNSHSKTIDNTPEIQIAKVNLNNQLIKEAYFKIYVGYTDPAGVKYGADGHISEYGKLIEGSSNYISGQTKDGYLYLTRNDFAKLPVGFDIKNYSGRITLRVVEVGISDYNYSLPSEALIITLEYEHGILTNYRENVDGNAIVHKLYDDPLTNIYKWSKGEATLYPYVEEMIKSWAKEEGDRVGMSYDDAVAYLVKYIEEHKEDISSNAEEWKVTAFVKEGIVSLIIQDEPGRFELPKLPEPEQEPFLMRIGGTVFLDQTLTKEGEKIADGLFGKGESTLYGIEVALYKKDGTLASLVQDVGGSDIRTNPTMTNQDGAYEFRGVDPFQEYYVEFKYNGIEYQATKSTTVGYNDSAWAVNSKGGEDPNATSGRDNYKVITPSTVAYDYGEIETLYREIADETWIYIKNNRSYPNWATVKAAVLANHNNGNSIDKELGAKLDYIKSTETYAKAGYSSVDYNQTYPHISVRGLNILDSDYANKGQTTVEFAGEMAKILYPQHDQIHLGLVERDSTDLSLKLDIAKTTTSINGKDEDYIYDEGETTYTGYIHEEDYNYSKTPVQDGSAYYYTEDNIHYYLTYEMTIKNASLTKTALLELVNYYNTNLIYKDVYKTTSGKTINGLKILYNDQDVTSLAGAKVDITKGNKYGYKTNYVKLSTPYNLVDGQSLKVQITYELVGVDANGKPRDNAKELLYSFLHPEEGYTGRYTKSIGIGSFAEIISYATEGGYLDVDSHPGNFDIDEYQAAMTLAREAYQKYILNGKTEEDARNYRILTNKALELFEDDAWTVHITLQNGHKKREVKGNVFEAINNEVSSSVDLQAEFGERYVTFNDSKDLALGGIKVELIELLGNGEKENGANQVVRAVTTTNENGEYKFTSYIPGNYTVRFTYGGYERAEDTVYSKVSKNTYENKDKADYLPINGQYYQSTKANPTTDNSQYWYADLNTRYSDAYDDSYTRLTQINNKIEGAENSTSSEYDLDGNMIIQRGIQNDKIYAYTSTMELEVEYAKTVALGNEYPSYYEYGVRSVDFGLTPRGFNDVNVGRYISNIKLYVEGLNTPLIDVEFTDEGKVIARDAATGSKYVADFDDFAGVSYKDGVIRINYEQLIQQRAHLELTYKVKVSNDSKYGVNNKGENVYDTIKYIFDGTDSKAVAVVYYGEETSKLVNYESEAQADGTKLEKLIYHNTMTDGGYDKNITKEKSNNSHTIENPRLGEYNVITGFKEKSRDIITSKALNVVDYPNSPLDFLQKDHLGNDINQNWVETLPNEYVSSRENYKIEDGEIKLLGIPGTENSILTKSHIIRATANSSLYKELKPGESTEELLILQHTLSTSVEDISGDSKTTDLSILDDEYSNLVEITRIANSAGKIVDTEGYDINANQEAETSKVRNISEVKTEQFKIDETRTVEVSTFKTSDTAVELTPTLSTGKSPTTVIAPPAGLPESSEWMAYTGTALVILIMLAGGIILIKKYVIVK